jgi:outer membrane protein W
MKRISSFVVSLLLLMSSGSFSQGMSRSSGIGLRASFWNITGRATRVSVNNSTGHAQVDVGGAGAWICYSSRAFNDIFLEMNLGAIGSAQVDQKDYFNSETTVDAVAIMPFLLGLRYDLFRTRLSGALHPYISGGGGPYWSWTVESKHQLAVVEETVESDFDYGGYLGGGVNIVLTSWFALTMDLKYHFINFSPEKDYSGIDFGLGFGFMWGRQREVFEIKDTKLVVTDIYPAYYQFYNTYPIALVTVKNLVGYAIDVNIRGIVRGFSQKPKDSGFVHIGGGETKDIPVTAFLGSGLQDVGKRKTAILDLVIEARAATTHKKEISTQIVIHSRNAWNGDMDKLGFFLTPDEDEVLDLSRKMAEQIPASSDERLDNFDRARSIFNQLGSRGIRYLPDPNIPFYQDDRVQFALETLQIGSGDCDDLVVLYASMLESLGIKTSFVEVRDPEKETAHLYLMFDSDLPAEDGYLISNNEKRYIVRQNSAGQNMIWIPIETTLISDGFEAAWNAAAMNYLQDGLLRDGIIQGWVNVIDVQ